MAEHASLLLKNPEFTFLLFALAVSAYDRGSWKHCKRRSNSSAGNLLKKHVISRVARKSPRDKIAKMASKVRYLIFQSAWMALPPDVVISSAHLGSYSVPFFLKRQSCFPLYTGSNGNTKVGLSMGWSFVELSNFSKALLRLVLS